ncbi:hypothetical protein PIIN_03309 [Serendipita indica DSM 11827]|uniref:Uncharacterized protein n=1 Tax=Serendipita indica (strain DSM 11827) TaxID=1109443 RepID=G4TDL0_SERID|nr:hypothetical protein PIIN_03309 [Serendipita indica DSM 11827]
MFYGHPEHQPNAANLLWELIEQDERALQEVKEEEERLENEREGILAHLGVLANDTQVLGQLAEVALPNIKNIIDALKPEISALETKREDGHFSNYGGWLEKYKNYIKVTVGFMEEIQHHKTQQLVREYVEPESMARLKLDHIDGLLKETADRIQATSIRLQTKRLKLSKTPFSRLTDENWRLIFGYASISFHPHHAGEQVCDRSISTSIHALTRVCHRWYKVIYQSSKLWRRVYLNYEGLKNDSSRKLLNLILSKAAEYVGHILDALPTPYELAIRSLLMTNTRLLYHPRSLDTLEVVEATNVELVLETGRNLPNLKLLKLQANTSITPCTEFYDTYSKTSTIDLAGGSFHLPRRVPRLQPWDAHSIRGTLNSILSVFSPRVVFTQLSEITLRFPPEPANMPDLATWCSFLSSSKASTVTSLTLYPMENAKILSHYVTALHNLARLRVHGSSVDPLLKELTWQVEDERSKVLTFLSVLEIHDYDGRGSPVVEFYQSKLASSYRTLRTVRFANCPNIPQEIRQIFIDN